MDEELRDKFISLSAALSRASIVSGSIAKDEVITREQEVLMEIIEKTCDCWRELMAEYME